MNLNELAREVHRRLPNATLLEALRKMRDELGERRNEYLLSDMIDAVRAARGLIETPRADELPNGSVVAHGDAVYVRRDDLDFSDPPRPWAKSGIVRRYTDAQVDSLLEDGAEVLRRGT